MTGFTLRFSSMILTCMFGLMCTLLAGICHGQSALRELVKKDYDQENLYYILSDLDERYSIGIRFNETLLPLGKFSYSFDKVPMGEVLNIIFLDKSLDYLEYAEDRIIVIPKKIIRSEDSIRPSYSGIPVLDTGYIYTKLGTPGIDPKAKVRITGILRDSQFYEPVPDALIRNLTTGQFVMSNGSGRFDLEIEPGKYRFQISDLSHETSYENIEFLGDNNWEVYLKAKNYFIDEVVISVKSADHNVKQTISGLEILGKKDIKQLTSFMGESDVVKSLLTIAGVLSSGDGATGYHVRGGSTDQNLILQDGALLFNPSHILGFFSTFNPDIVQTTSLNKGHIPAYYGGRVSSVLDIDLKEADYEDFGINGGIGLISSKISAEIPVIKSKSSLLLSGRSSYAGWMLSRVDDLDIQKSDARFHDINVKYSHKLNNQTKITTSFFRSFDKFLYSDEFGYSWRNQIGSLQLRHLIGQNLSLALDAAIGSLSNKQFEPDGPLAFDLDSGLNYKQIKVQALLDQAPHTIRVGGEIIDYKGRPEILSPIKESQISHQEVAKENGREMGLFLNDQWKFNSKLSLDLGIRFSFYAQIGPASVNQYLDDFYFDTEQVIANNLFGEGEVIKTYSGIEPRISLRYSILDDLSIKLSYNRSFQYIHLLSNASAPTPVDIWQVSNAHILPLAAHSYSLGIFSKMGDLWDLSIDGYYRSLDNTIDPKDFANFLLKPNLETRILLGQGRVYGVELSLVKNGAAVSGRISYSYGRSERRTNKTSIETINGGRWFPSNFDQPHSLKFFINWKISKRDRINLNFTYSSGRPITAPISNYTVQGIVIADFSDRNAFRLPDYHRLDLGYTFTLNRARSARFKSDLSFSIYNLYARRNAFSIFYRQQLGSTVNALRLSVIGSMIPSVTYNFQF